MVFHCDKCPKYFDTDLLLLKHKNIRHNYKVNINIISRNHSDIFLDDFQQSAISYDDNSQKSPKDYQLSSGSLLVRVHQYQSNLVKESVSSNDKSRLVEHNNNYDVKEAFFNVKDREGVPKLCSFDGIKNCQNQIDEIVKQHFGQNRNGNHFKVLAKEMNHRNDQKENGDERLKGLRNRLNMLEEILVQLSDEVYKLAEIDNKSRDNLLNVIKKSNHPMTSHKSISAINTTREANRTPFHTSVGSTMNDSCVIDYNDNTRNSINQNQCGPENSEIGNNNGEKIEGKPTTSTWSKYERPFVGSQKAYKREGVEVIRSIGISKSGDKDCNYAVVEESQQSSPSDNVGGLDDINRTRATDWSTLCQMITSITRQTILYELSQQKESDINESPSHAVNGCRTYNNTNGHGDINNITANKNGLSSKQIEIDPNTHDNNSMISSNENFELLHDKSLRILQQRVDRADKVSLVKRDNNMQTIISDRNDNIKGFMHYDDIDELKHPKSVVNDQAEGKKEFGQNVVSLKFLDSMSTLNLEQQQSLKLQATTSDNKNVSNNNSNSMKNFTTKSLRQHKQESSHSEFITSSSLTETRDVLLVSANISSGSGGGGGGEEEEEEGKERVTLVAGQTNYGDNRKLNSRHDFVQLDDDVTSKFSPSIPNETQRVSKMIGLSAENKIDDNARDHKDPTFFANEARSASGIDDCSLASTDYSKYKSIACGLKVTRLTNSNGDENDDDYSQLEATETNNKLNSDESKASCNSEISDNNLSGVNVCKDVEESSKTSKSAADSFRKSSSDPYHIEAASIAIERKISEEVTSNNKIKETTTTTFINGKGIIYTNISREKDDLNTTTTTVLKTEPIEGKDNDNLFWGSSEPLFGSSRSVSQEKDKATRLLLKENLSDNLSKRQKQRGQCDSKSSMREKLADLMTLPPSNNNEISNSSSIDCSGDSGGNSISPSTQLDNYNVSCEQQQASKQQQKLDCLYENVTLAAAPQEERDLTVDGRVIVCCDNSVGKDKSDSSAIKNNNNTEENENEIASDVNHGSKRASRIAGECETEVKKVNSTDTTDKFYHWRASHAVGNISKANLLDSNKVTRMDNHSLGDVSSVYSKRDSFCFPELARVIQEVSKNELEAPLNSLLASGSSLVADTNDGSTFGRQKELKEASETVSSVLGISEQNKLNGKDRFELEKQKKVQSSFDDDNNVTNISVTTDNLKECSNEKNTSTNKEFQVLSQLEITKRDEILSNSENQQSLERLSFDKDTSYDRYTEEVKHKRDTSPTKSICFAQNELFAENVMKSESSKSLDDGANLNITKAESNDKEILSREVFPQIKHLDEKQQESRLESEKLSTDVRNNSSSTNLNFGSPSNNDDFVEQLSEKSFTTTRLPGSENDHDNQIKQPSSSTEIANISKYKSSPTNLQFSHQTAKDQGSGKAPLSSTSINLKEDKMKGIESYDQMGHSDKGLFRELQSGASSGDNEIVGNKRVSGIVITSQSKGGNSDKGEEKFIGKINTTTTTTTTTTVTTSTTSVRKLSKEPFESDGSEVGRLLKLDDNKEEEKERKENINNNTDSNRSRFKEVEAGGNGWREDINEVLKGAGTYGQGHEEKVAKLFNNTPGRSKENLKIGLPSGSGTDTTTKTPKKLKSILKRTIKANGKHEEVQKSALSPELSPNLIQTAPGSSISNHWSESASGPTSTFYKTINDTTAPGSSSYLEQLPSALKLSPNSRREALKRQKEQEIATSGVVGMQQLSLALKPQAIMSLKEDASTIASNNKKQISGDASSTTKRTQLFSSSSSLRPVSASNRQASLVSNSSRSLLMDSHLSSYNSNSNSNVANQAELDWHSNHSEPEQPTEAITRRRSFVRFSDTKSVLELSPRESSSDSRCSSDADGK